MAHLSLVIGLSANRLRVEEALHLFFGKLRSYNNNNNNIYFDLSIHSIKITVNYLVLLFSVVNILKSGHC